MAQRTCSVEGCGTTTGRLKLGMCGKHYQRFKLHGSTDLPPKVYRTCEGPSCNRRAGTSGLCRSHYKQRHLGKPLAPLKASTKDLNRPPICSVPDCGRPHKARGLCKSHSERAKKGLPLGEIQARGQMTECVEPGCVSTPIARDMCSKHLNWLYNSTRKYGLNVGEYEQMLASQGGVCAICGGVNANGYRLSIDHDHSCCPGNKSCGECVRALLCARCNFAIGHMGDSPDMLRRAADYLESHR